LVSWQQAANTYNKLVLRCIPSGTNYSHHQLNLFQKLKYSEFKFYMLKKQSLVAQSF